MKPPPSGALSLCIRQQAAPCAAITAAMRGSARRALTSFIISAPAARAASATAALVVSTDMGASDTARSASTTGTTRRISSAASTGA